MISRRVLTLGFTVALGALFTTGGAAQQAKPQAKPTSPAGPAAIPASARAMRLKSRRCLFMPIFLL